MKLITRYNRFNLPVLLLLFFISSIASYFLIRQVLLNELDKNIIHTMNSIKKYVQEQKKIPEIIPLTSQVVEINKVNAPFADTGFQTINPDPAYPMQHHLHRKLVFQLQQNQSFYRVSISSPLEGAKHLTILLLKITIFTTFLIILVSIFISRFILSKLWLPFYESLDVLRNFRIDNPTPLSFPATTTDEFKFMIESLKAATNKEAETYQSLKEFTENASHEIQTPLAIIRSKLDIIIQNEDLSEQDSEISKSVYSAIDKLSRLNKSLLLISKIGNSQFVIKKNINLAEKVREKLSQFEELWFSSNIKVESKIIDTAIIMNEELIDILLNNLLSNATRHNMENGKINIELQPGSLSVINTGAQIALDQKRIFKRFYKANQHSENNGLGLSIIKQICDVSDIDLVYSFSFNMHSFKLTWISSY
jgi:signal transduction histidine kinase